MGSEMCIRDRLRSCVRSVIDDHAAKSTVDTVPDEILTEIPSKQGAYESVLFWYLLEQALTKEQYVALAAKYRYGLIQADTAKTFSELFKNPMAVYHALQRAMKAIRDDDDLSDMLRSLL